LERAIARVSKLDARPTANQGSQWRWPQIAGKFEFHRWRVRLGDLVAPRTEPTKGPPVLASLRSIIDKRSKTDAGPKRADVSHPVNIESQGTLIFVRVTPTEREASFDT